VHTANAFVSAHRRFFLTGVQIGLQPDDAQQTEQPTPTASAAAAPLQALYSDNDINWAAGPDGGISGNLPDWSVVDEQFSSPVQKPAEPVVVAKPISKRSPRGAVAAAYGGIGGGMHDWPLDEFFGFSEFNAGLSFAENGTSKVSTECFF
jgi:hypothetical protein